MSVLGRPRPGAAASGSLYLARRRASARRPPTSGSRRCKRERPAHQPARPLLVGRDRASGSTSTGRGRAPAWVLFIVGQFLFFAGDLYTYSYPKLFGADVGVPVARRRASTWRSTRRSMAGLLVLVRRRNPQRDRGGVDRLADPDHRLRPALVGLPDRSEHPPLRAAHAVREGRSRSRIRSETCCCSPPRSASRSMRASARRPSTCSSAASSRLLATDSAYTYALLKGTLQPPADLRRRLDRVLPPLGRGRAPPVDADARGAGARLAHPPDPAPSRAARRSLPDRAGHPLRRRSSTTRTCSCWSSRRRCSSCSSSARMAGLVRQEERAATRELALRSAGVELVAAGGREQVNEAAIAAVQALLGKPASVSASCSSPETRPSVAASSEAARRRVAAL